MVCFDKLIGKEIVGVEYDETYLSLYTKEGRYNFKATALIDGFDGDAHLKGQIIKHVADIRSGVLFHTASGVFRIQTWGKFVSAKGRPKTGLHTLFAAKKNKHRITITIVAEYDADHEPPDAEWLSSNVKAAVDDGLLNDHGAQTVSWSKTIKEG